MKVKCAHSPQYSVQIRSSPGPGRSICSCECKFPFSGLSVTDSISYICALFQGIGQSLFLERVGDKYMELVKTGIYPFIKDYPEACKLIRLDNDVNFCPAYDESRLVWYLVSGSVNVCATSYTGRTVAVDNNVPDEFTGHLSNYWGQNFYANCITSSPSELLSIPNQLFDDLMRKPEFAAFFYFKVSVRLYDMFKHELMVNLFSGSQIFAQYLITNAHDGICHLDNAGDVCGSMRMSRRNFYNKLSQFEEQGLISHPSADTIRLIDEKGLNKIASPVIKYMNNEL